MWPVLWTSHRIVWLNHRTLLCCGVAQGGTSRETAQKRDSGQHCRNSHSDDYAEPRASGTRSHKTIMACEKLRHAVSQAKPPDDGRCQYQRHRDGGQDRWKHSEAQELLRYLAARDCEANQARAGDGCCDERPEKDTPIEKQLPHRRKMVARAVEGFQEKSCPQENREGQDGNGQQEQGTASLLRERGP